MRVLDGEVRAQVLDRMRFVNHEQRRPFELENAITDAPTISNTITGGSTVEVTLADADRKLVRSKLVETRSWLVVDGRRYELVGIG